MNISKPTSTRKPEARAAQQLALAPAPALSVGDRAWLAQTSARIEQLDVEIFSRDRERRLLRDQRARLLCPVKEGARVVFRGQQYKITRVAARGGEAAVNIWGVQVSVKGRVGVVVKELRQMADNLAAVEWLP